MPDRRFTPPRILLPTALLLSLGVIALTAGILYAMGRTPICTCGTVKFWHGLLKNREMSQQFTDWYTYSHIVHGIIFYWIVTWLAGGRLSVGARLLIAVLMEAGWEIFENTDFIINRYRQGTVSSDYTGDSILNTVGDILAMIVGFLIASRLPAWITVILLLVVEVGLALWIRDNLTLNIIMLIHPVDWIKAWQAAGG